MDDVFAWVAIVGGPVWAFVAIRRAVIRTSPKTWEPYVYQLEQNDFREEW